jgi:hypothetical protein
MRMTSTGKRDNAYWLQRLEKDGHRSLIERINAGEITVYSATQLAGYRPQGRRSPASNLSHHWKRASAADRKLFVAKHAAEVNRVLLELRDEAKARQEQKNKATD